MSNNHQPPRTWWPKNHSEAKALGLKLRTDGDGNQLFELLVLAMATHDWGTFSAVIEALCDVNARAIKTMLENQKFDIGWTLLYGSTGMPRELMPLFVEILKVARQFEQENGHKLAPKALRLAIIQQALASPALRRMQTPADLKAALLD